MKNKKVLLQINISKNRSLDFFEDYLIYKDKKIFYRDIDGIAYLWEQTKHSLFFIPVSTSDRFRVSIRSKDEKYDIFFSSSMFPEETKKKREAFNQVHYIFENFLKSCVLINLLTDYIQQDQLEICDLQISMKGIQRKKFWNNYEILPWAEYYSSFLHEGYLYIFKKTDNKEGYGSFFSCPVSQINAVVLPDLLNFLFQTKGVIDEKTRKELINKSQALSPKSDSAAEMNVDIKEQSFCSHCGKKFIIKEQNFCEKCGEKVK